MHTIPNVASVASFRRLIEMCLCCRKGKLDAYLGDYPILDYARAHLAPSCELKLVSKIFGDDQYGLGLPKESPLKVGVLVGLCSNLHFHLCLLCTVKQCIVSSRLNSSSQNICAHTHAHTCITHALTHACTHARTLAHTCTTL